MTVAPLRRKRSGLSAPGAEARLQNLDRGGLAAELSQASGRALESCERTAARALSHAFRRDAEGPASWDDAALTETGIGAWARPALLARTPEPSLTIAERAPSGDGTVRLLLRAEDGALVESVIIPAQAGRDRARTTLCISSQVGCARACSFCETGRLGLERQLRAAEIVDQYRIAARICRQARPADLRSTEDGDIEPLSRISNLVFMGMGEPMDNLREVARAIELLCDPCAFGFAPSRITVSTVGAADKLATFFASTRAELAISINAPDDRRRSAIMPINDRFSLAELRAELLRVLPPGRRVLFQYALFAGFNDSLADADLLAEYVSAVPCRVNVIPANPGPDRSLTAPTPEQVDAFVARLRSRGVIALVRAPRGRDVGGACGQLAGSRRADRELREAAPCP